MARKARVIVDDTHAAMSLLNIMSFVHLVDDFAIVLQSISFLNR